MTFARPCGCPCGGCAGLVTVREQSQRMTRCKACRQEPSPVCLRVQANADPRLRPRRVVCVDGQRVVEVHGETQRIEALLAHYAKQRKAQRFQAS